MSLSVSGIAMLAKSRIATTAQAPEPQSGPHQHGEDQERQACRTGEDEHRESRGRRGERRGLHNPPAQLPERPLRRHHQQRRGDDEIAAHVAQPPRSPDRAVVTAAISSAPRRLVTPKSRAVVLTTGEGARASTSRTRSSEDGGAGGRSRPRPRACCPRRSEDGIDGNPGPAIRQERAQRYAGPQPVTAGTSAASAMPVGGHRRHARRLESQLEAELRGSVVHAGQRDDLRRIEPRILVDRCAGQPAHAAPTACTPHPLAPRDAVKAIGRVAVCGRAGSRLAADRPVMGPVAPLRSRPRRRPASCADSIGSPPGDFGEFRHVDEELEGAAVLPRLRSPSGRHPTRTRPSSAPSACRGARRCPTGARTWRPARAPLLGPTVVTGRDAARSRRRARGDRGSEHRHPRDQREDDPQLRVRNAVRRLHKTLFRCLRG